MIMELLQAVVQVIDAALQLPGFGLDRVGLLALDRELRHHRDLGDRPYRHGDPRQGEPRSAQGEKAEKKGTETKEEGREAEREEFVRKLLSKGKSAEIIADDLDLDVSFVKSIEEKMLSSVENP